MLEMVWNEQRVKENEKKKDRKIEIVALSR